MPDPRLLDYLVIMINIINNKKVEIESLKLELANCTNKPQNIQEIIINLEKQVTVLQQQLNNPNIVRDANEELINKLLAEQEKTVAPTVIKEIRDCTEPIHPYINPSDNVDAETNKLLDTNDLVDIITNNSFNPIDSTKQSMSFPRSSIPIEGYSEKDEEYVLKNELTGLATNTFFELPETTTQFIRVINEIFTKTFDAYAQRRNIQGSINFIYKGGNALKAIFLSYIYENPGVVSDSIMNSFLEYFNKSDADFEIYVSPDVNNYEVVYNEVSDLTYLILTRLRMIFNLNLSKWFDFYKKKNIILKSIMATYLAKLNATPRPGFYENANFLNMRFLDVIAGQDINLTNPNLKIIDTQKFYNNAHTYWNKSTRSDIVIFANNNDNVLVQKIQQNNTELFITYNKSLNFTKNNVNIKFNLVRMKINFTTIFTKDNSFGITNVPAELIDVSIPHRDSHEMQINLKNNNNSWRDFINNNVVTYDYNKEFTYKSYSRQYYINDIYRIMFLETDYPWESPKYEKRLWRLLFLCMIDLFTANTDANKQLLDDFVNIFNDPARSQLLITNLGLMETNFTNNNLPNMALLTRIIKQVAEKPGVDDNVKFTEFIDIINEFVAKYLTIYTDFAGFINARRIDPARLQIQHQLGGTNSSDYKVRYLKYKQMYLDTIKCK
jgi:hypothetical protein